MINEQAIFLCVKLTATDVPAMLPKAQIACSLMSELGEDTKQTR
jgi:hypothetical protein